MKKVFLTIITILLPIIASADFVQTVRNEDTNVFTNVITNVSTGGSTSGGDSKSSVKVYTEVNGQVIEDFEKEVRGTEEINYEAEKKFEGGKVETKINVNTEPKVSVETNMSRTLLDTNEVSKTVFNTKSSHENNENEGVGFGKMFREKVKQIFKNVFSFFKFK